jgi:tetratricopeptide (TPR) repeat protein
MKIAELRMETHHRGKLLKVRRVADVVKLVTCSWTVVQDEAGEMERLEICLHKSRYGREVLEGDVFQVKEPWFTVSEMGENTIRIDHPSDLVVCTADSSHSTKNGGDSDNAVNITALTLAAETAKECKEQGNLALKQRSLPLAHKHYTHGLQLLTSSDTAKEELANDLYRNRSYVNLLLNRHDEAKADALSSLTALDDQKHRDLDSKAYFRAGCAAYSLSSFQDAKRFFEEQMKLSPGDKDGKSCLRKTELRIQEQESGVYDFRKLKAGLLLAKARPRIDAASFTLNVKISESPGRGRGLFAARPIDPDALILVEKAFCVVWGREQEALTAMTYDYRDDKIRISPAGLCKAVVAKLRNNPSQVGKVLDLFGDYAGIGNQVVTKDGGAVIDVFQVHDIVARNAFGLGPGDEDARNASTGLWITAAYINHSCIPNAKKEFIGDLMVLRATRAIAAGEEITHAYDESSDYDARTKALMNTWGFVCRCALCKAEKEDDPAVREKRRELEGEASVLVEREEARGAKRLVVLKARRIKRGIEDTYDDERYNGLPRMALMRIQKWLDEATAR